MDQPNARKTHRWTWPILLALTIFLASGSGNLAGPSIVHFDKLVHFLIFGLIGVLVLRSRGKPTWRWTLCSILLTSAFGAFDEFRQSFTPGRSVEYLDWMADTLGATVAILLYKTIPSFSAILEKRLPGKTRQEDVLPKSSEA